MRNKKIIILVLVLIIIIAGLFIILRSIETKNFKIGNNTNSQEIVDHILNINSYEAIVEVDVKSNKNENKYIIKQIYNGEDKNSHEVLEPSNIAGVKIIREGTNLKLENSNLNITSILKNYEYISDNVLDLSSFIKNFKDSNSSEWQEKDDIILMKTLSNEDNKTLYINKQKGLPEKMEIKDNDKNTAVYILYREVNVNS